MKTASKWASRLIISLLALVCFSSCETDDDIGYGLSGAFGKVWYGDFGAEDEQGYPLYSELFFSSGRDNSYGTGWEKTYYQDNGEPAYSDNFDWEVVNGVLYLHFQYQGDLEIYDFFVGATYFKGRFSNGNWFELYLDRQW